MIVSVLATEAHEASGWCIIREGKKDMSEFVTTQIVAAQALVAKLRERAEEGQGMVEYALILAFISILVIVALKFLQPAISNTLNNVTNSL
jgi:Flp pilus assembly pilin Flp